MEFKDKLQYLMQTAWSRDFTFQEFIWLSEDAKLEHSVTQLEYTEYCALQETEMETAFKDLEADSGELFK